MPEPGGAEAKILGYLRAWLANLVLASVDIGVSLTSGGVALGIALSCDAARPGWWFVVGACLPLGPLGLWATSRRAFRDELIMVKRLRDDALITEAEYDAQRARILAARSDRLHGNSPPRPEIVAGRPRRKAKGQGPATDPGQAPGSAGPPGA